MNKRSKGLSVRKEDDVNNLDRDGFIDYLKKTYIPIPPNPPNLNFAVDFRDSWLNCLAFHFLHSPPIAWSTYPLLIVYDKQNNIVCFNIKKRMKILSKIFEYIQEKYTLKENMSDEYILIPKDGSKYTYKMFIDLIDGCLERVEPPYELTLKKERT